MSTIQDSSHAIRPSRTLQAISTSSNAAAEDFKQEHGRHTAMADAHSSLLRCLGSEQQEDLERLTRRAGIARLQQLDVMRATGRALPSDCSSQVSQEELQNLAAIMEAAEGVLPPLRSNERNEGHVSEEAPADLSTNDTAASADEAAGAGSNLIDDIFALLDRLDKEWLSRFGDILSNYVGFFNKLSEAMALLGKAIIKTDGKGNLGVDFTPLLSALDELIQEAQGGPGLGGDFKTQAEAEAFLKELGVEGLIVKPKSGGGFELAVDPSMIRDLRELFVLKGTTLPIYINPAKHAAIISAKDSLMERFNHINRVIPDKYQRQLQLWDTLVKALSGTIDSMAEVNRLFAQNT